MRDSERWIVALQLVMLIAIAVLLCAVGELLIRARPRVFYVHSGGRRDANGRGDSGPSDDPMAEPIPIRRPKMRDAQGGVAQGGRSAPDKPAA